MWRIVWAETVADILRFAQDDSIFTPRSMSHLGCNFPF
jgi:hypothetical protein